MKTVIATTLAMALVGTAGAAAAETVKYTTKGSHADATWSASDDCSYSYVSVSAGESVTRQTKTGPVSGSMVSVSYSMSNWCTDEYSYVSGYADGAGEVTVGAKSVSAKATLFGYDYMTGETNTIEVEFSAQANGESATRGFAHEMYSSGMTRFQSRQASSYQSADATGQVILNGTPLATGAASWSSIGKSSYGTKEVFTADAVTP